MRYSWYSYLLEAEPRQDRSAAGRIQSIENPNDPIGNRTRILSICNAEPQPTAPLRTPIMLIIFIIIIIIFMTAAIPNYIYIYVTLWKSLYGIRPLEPRVCSRHILYLVLKTKLYNNQNLNLPPTFTHITKSVQILWSIYLDCHF
jgi:hypothetical protein